MRSNAKSTAEGSETEPVPEHSDTSKLFTSKNTKSGPMPIAVNLEDDIELSLRPGMRNIAWKNRPPESVTKVSSTQRQHNAGILVLIETRQAPTEQFPPLSAPTPAPPTESLPYSIGPMKEKKKGKGRKK